MATNKNAYAVHAYSLSDLLGGKLTLVIPDIQRDFTWGGEQSAILTRGLAHMFLQLGKLKQQPSPVGMIYGYSSDQGHINVIDGQQRLTTIYLLLGMLYRRTSLPEVRKLLVDEESVIGDQMPRILYQSKREALYFMADLVGEFFLNRDGRLSKLEESHWYYSSYSSDVSVQSFIGALRQIDGILETYLKKPGWDFEAFARFVANDIVFRYCNLEDRATADKMFVTINTTGEPLALAQNLRASFLATNSPEEEADNLWNKMEQWFWENRLEEYDSCDILFDKFLTLAARYLQISQNLEPQIPIPKILPEQETSEIYRIFTGFTKAKHALENVWKDVLGKDFILDLPLNNFLLIPVLEYCLAFPNATDSEINRFENYLLNLSRYQRPTPNGSDTKLGMELARRLPSADILSALEIHRISDRILNNDEKDKMRLIRENISRREKIERVFEKGQAHPLLSGRISQVIKWSFHNNEDDFLPRLENYIDEIYRIFGTNIHRQDSLDMVRRLLLALHHPGYPIVRRSDAILSLCWHDYDWQRLMTESPGIIRLLIDRLDTLSPSEIISRYEHVEDSYYPFVKDGHLLGSCRKKQLMRPCKPFIGFYDLEQGRTRWLLEQKPISLPAEKWSPWRTYGKRCLCTRNSEDNIGVDIVYTPEYRTPFRLELMDISEGAARRNQNRLLMELADQELGYRYNKRRNMYTAIGDAKHMLYLLNRLIND